MELRPGGRPFVRIFLHIWFFFWTVFGLYAIVTLLSGGALRSRGGHEMTPEMAGLLICIWAAAWAYVLLIHLWLFFGHEKLELSGASFIKSVMTPLFTRSQTYETTRIGDAFRTTETPKRSLPKLPYIQGGDVEFDYVHRKISFGAGLGQPQAQYVANRLTLQLQQSRGQA